MNEQDEIRYPYYPNRYAQYRLGNIFQKSYAYFLLFEHSIPLEEIESQYNENTLITQFEFMMNLIPAAVNEVYPKSTVFYLFTGVKAGKKELICNTLIRDTVIREHYTELTFFGFVVVKHGDIKKFLRYDRAKYEPYVMLDYDFMNKRYQFMNLETNNEPKFDNLRELAYMIRAIFIDINLNNDIVKEASKAFKDEFDAINE